MIDVLLMVSNRQQKTHQHNTFGFTIVELLIVVVVIAILATISLIAYNGIQRSAAEAQLKAELNSLAKQLSNERTTQGTFPSTIDELKTSGGIDYNYIYNSSDDSWCLMASNNWSSFFIRDTALSPQSGVCDVPLLAVGRSHSCATYSGTLYCWGSGTFGVIGDGTQSGFTTPEPVDTSLFSGKVITDLSSQEVNSCLVADGAAYCWGSNSSGQLGNGTSTQANTPVAVTTSGVLSGLTVTKVSTGAQGHTCAIADGAAYCWGANNYGQLGNNSTTSTTTAVTVTASGVLSGLTVTNVSAGLHFTCAIANSTAYCWGRNANGQLGNNSTTNSSVAVSVDTSGVLSGKTITDISASSSHACVVASGEAFCWGSNANGQLGNNSTTQSLVPVAVNTAGVLSGKTVTKIAAGRISTCAIADGAAYCWGGNGYGQLGNNSTTQSLVPVAVNTAGVLSGVTLTDIDLNGGADAASGHTCAQANSGVYCWGNGSSGRLGNGLSTQSSVPVIVTQP